MTDEELYLRTIEDLEARIQNPDEYNVIRAAGLLRSLLVDAPALVHAANRQTRLKLAFRQFQAPNLGHIARWGVVWESSENPHFPSNVFVKLDGFLASTPMFVGNRLYSVCDLIKLWANVRGGVHIGTPREHEKLMEDVDKTTVVMRASSTSEDGYELVLSISGYGIAKIAEVALEGMRPLIEALKAKTTAGGN